MNRKQALIEAIDILSESSENKDIVKKLEEILSELPLSSWTKNSVIDRIETYAAEHNDTLPAVSELTKSNKLPSNTEIKYLFGYSSVIKFFNEYFPHLKIKPQRFSPYYSNDGNYFIETFKENYEIIKEKFSLKTVSARTYRIYRKEKTPTVETIMKKCGCTTYNELLALCGYKKEIPPLYSSVSLSINTEETEASEYIKSILPDYQHQVI